MKVAFVVGYFPALSETFVLNQITGLIDQGFEVDIYASHARKESKMHPDVTGYNLLSKCRYFNPPPGRLKRIVSFLGLFALNFHRRPLTLLDSVNVMKYKHEAATLKLFYAALAMLRIGKQEYDVIYCHFGQNGNIGMFLKENNLLGGKLVTTFHGYDMSAYLQKTGGTGYAKLFETGDLFLPVSERWKEELMSFGCPKDKIRVHRMGIDVGKFRSKKLAEESNPVRVVSVARLMEKKGIEYAIKSVAGAIRTKSGIQYDIIGDGPLRSSLQALIDQYEAGGNIKLLGPKTHEEIIRHIERSDIFMAPSVTAQDGDQEGIPVAIMEAMASGLPVLSTWHSGIPELVKDGVSGFLVPEREVDQLTEKLILLADNPDIRFAMGRAGREIIEEQFNLSKLNRQLGNLFIHYCGDKEALAYNIGVANWFRG